MAGKKDKQIEELTNNWKRALADYQNLEKRMSQEKKEWGKFATGDLILKLLPVLDNLEKAARHLKNTGLNLALKQFLDVLRNEGLEPLEVVGKEFNPQEMECLEVVAGDEENKVAEEVRRGYKLEGKVLRVAQVKVTKLEV